jgi:hypothetical protein
MPFPKEPQSPCLSVYRVLIRPVFSRRLFGGQRGFRILPIAQATVLDIPAIFAAAAILTVAPPLRLALLAAIRFCPPFGKGDGRQFPAAVILLLTAIFFTPPIIAVLTALDLTATVTGTAAAVIPAHRRQFMAIRTTHN